MYGHNPEDGHKCSGCGAYMICTIEDGSCGNQGSCSTCDVQNHFDLVERYGERYLQDSGYYDQ
jgi:hypothetical protein